MISMFGVHCRHFFVNYIFRGQKKHAKTLRFWYFFLSSEVGSRKSRIKSRCFARTADDFFSKHYVSLARNDSFQCSVRCPSMLAARGQYESLWPGPDSRGLFRAPGVRLHLDCATVRLELRPPEFDSMPYAGFQALKAYCHVDIAILKIFIFRQNSEFGHLRSIFLSKEHSGTLRYIF